MLLPSRDIIKQIISLYAFSVFLALVCLSSFLVRCHCCTIALCGNQRRRPTFPSVDIGQTLHGPAPPSPPHVRGVVLKVDGAVTENEIFNEPVFFALPSATPARGLFFFLQKVIWVWGGTSRCSGYSGPESPPENKEAIVVK